jgi:hypothetical protein
MLPNPPKYVRPGEIEESRARLRRTLIWIAFAIPAAFVFLAWGYSDGRPAQRHHRDRPRVRLSVHRTAEHDFGLTRAPWRAHPASQPPTGPPTDTWRG